MSVERVLSERVCGSGASRRAASKKTSAAGEAARPGNLATLPGSKSRVTAPSHFGIKAHDA